MDLENGGIEQQGQLKFQQLKDQDSSSGSMVDSMENLNEDNGGSGQQQQQLSDDAGDKKEEHIADDKSTQSDEDGQDLDEDDLDLIAENYGLKNSSSNRNELRRLKRMREITGNNGDAEDVGNGGSPVQNKSSLSSNNKGDLNNLFSDEDDVVGPQHNTGAQKDQVAKKAKVMKFSANEEQELLEDEEGEEEDSDGFEGLITREQGSGAISQRFKQSAEQQSKGPVRSKQKKTASVAQQLGLSVEDWAEVQDMFGDGEEYAYALGPSQQSDDEDAEQQYGEQVEYDDDMAEQNGDTLQKQIQRQSRGRGENSKLEDVYEPAEVAEKMFTARDDRIRQVDMPERYQLSGCFSEQSDADLKTESSWIAVRLCELRQEQGQKSAELYDQPLLDCIENVLELMVRQLFEVPFIQRHRSDQYSSQLSDSEIWTVLDLHEQYVEIEKRKHALRRWQHVAMDINLESELSKIQSLDAVRDMTDYLQTRYRKQMEEFKQQKVQYDQQTDSSTSQGIKRPVQRDAYTVALENNLQQFASQIALKSHEFARNIEDQYPSIQPQDLDVDIRQLAEQYLSDELLTTDSVMRATRFLMAREISTELSFRSSMRQLLGKSAIINVYATEKGKIDIDEQHDYYAFKYLREKPVVKIDEMQFLWIMKATSEGLVTFKIECDVQSTFDQYCRLYLSNGYSSYSDLFNQERRKVLQEAMQLQLQSAKVWIIEQHRQKSIRFILDKIENQFMKSLKMQPHQAFIRGSNYQMPSTPAQNERRRLIAAKRGVLAVSCGDGDFSTAAFAAFVLEDGSVQGHIKLSAIHSRNQEAQKQDLMKLVEFVEELVADGQLAALAIGGWSIQTRFLYENIFRTLQAQGIRVPVYYTKDETARIYQSSSRAEKEFPIYPPVLRYCVGIGRYVIDPLSEYAAMFNADKDALYLPLHVMQDLMPKDQLYKRMERCMISMVNDVGVDVNAVIERSTALSLLQFVCGLGPRKAQMIVQRIVANGGLLNNRVELVSVVKLASVVFQNCCSFFKFQQDDEDEDYDNRRGNKRQRAAIQGEVLDSTRIHPEDYGVARKIVFDALGREYVDSSTDQTVADFMHDQEALKSLSALKLDEYADVLKQERGVVMTARLELIRKELKRPYRDPRQPFSPPSQDELFTILTGESDQSLRIGMVLPAMAFRVKDQFATFKLANGVDGYMTNQAMGSFAQRPQEHFKEGQTYRVKIISIEKDKFQVNVQVFEVADKFERYRQIKRDEYFDVNAEAKDLNLLNKARPTNEQLKRTIKHPLFFNFSYRECQDYLRNRPVGDCVFRPSSRGKDNLVLSWKVGEGIYQHVDIKERRKESDYGLGKELWIENEKFSDLDEIKSFYINPMVRNLQVAQKHPKYRAMSRDDVEVLVEQEIQINPQRVPYFMCLANDKPGKLYLIYKLGSGHNVLSETITCINVGYRFRGVVYKGIQEAINAFKTVSSNGR
ncbi:hypothetical protein MP228_005690 [Amoeboaphelidium protococcarum]|nr:hypothetical protein MP228_005690 [Amoeboaphelidium protococcarum]